MHIESSSRNQKETPFKWMGFLVAFRLSKNFVFASAVRRVAIRSPKCCDFSIGLKEAEAL